jgi:hypothetical protein
MAEDTFDSLAAKLAAEKRLKQLVDARRHRDIIDAVKDPPVHNAIDLAIREAELRQAESEVVVATDRVQNAVRKAWEAVIDARQDPQMAAELIKELATTIELMGYDDRIPVMVGRQSGDAVVSWTLLQEATGMNVESLADRIRALPRFCRWWGVFRYNLPDDFFADDLHADNEDQRAVTRNVWKDVNQTAPDEFPAGPLVGKDEPTANKTSSPKEDETLAKLKEPLSPLQRKILDSLWKRTHQVDFRTLRDEVWTDSNPYDSSIVRRLKEIERRWFEAEIRDFDLIISTASACVKLVRPCL